MKTLWTKRIVIGTIGLFLLLAALWQLINSRNYQIFGRLVNEGDPSLPRIALTFDDGPVPGTTEQLLAILAKADIKATFFVTGRELSESPDLGRAIVEAGHQLGNHTWSHKRMIFKDIGWIQDEVKKTNEAIRQTGYQGEIMFRPPYGKKLLGLPWVLRKLDMTTIMWNSEPDSKDNDAKGIAEEALKNLHGGTLILMHVMYPSRKASLAAVEQIIAQENPKGWSS